MRVSTPEIAARAGLAHLALTFEDASIRPMPGWMRRLLGTRVSAITLLSVVFVEPDRYTSMIDGRDATLLAHELIHVAQWQTEGIARFLYRYVTDYLRLRLLGLDHRTAYLHIGYEWDAYEQSAALTDVGLV